MREREVPVRIIIRKKKGGHPHHGGAWKVALADFMTAMFALFLVMWLVTQSTDIRSAVAGYFQDPLGRSDEFGSSIMPGEGAQAATVRPLTPPDVVNMRRDRMERFAEQIKKEMEKFPDLAEVREHVEIEITDEGLRIQLTEDPKGVFFQTGSPVLSPRGQEILALLGHQLGLWSNEVRIDGYTDARPYSGISRYTNWELSADRSNAARRILTSSGLRAGQITQIRGHADRDLKDPADPLAAKNRRITITMLFGDTESTPAPAPADSVPAAAADHPS
jgi:chemotaxis protein MotB